jgi:hypothetical protein
MHWPQLLAAAIIGASGGGCVAPRLSAFPLAAISGEGEATPVSVRIVDRRFRALEQHRPELVVEGDLLVAVQNRVEAEIARHGLVNGAGPELGIELLDFAWDWRRVSLFGFVARASAVFRMQVSFAGKVAVFSAERSGEASSGLELIAEQLELAMDDGMKQLGQWDAFYGE